MASKTEKNKQILAPNIIKASLYAIAAFFFMATFGIATKMGLNGGSAFWVSFIVYLTGTLTLVPYILYKGLPYLKSEHYKELWARAIIGTIASFCYTVSINYIPIVNGTLLFNTAPLFIPILAMLFLKESIAKSTWVSVLIGFIGIIIIIRPTLEIFTQTGNMIGIISGLSLAIAYLLTKQLTLTEPGIRIIIYYLGIGALFQIPLLFFARMPSTESVLYSILGGLFLLAAQIALVTAYKYADASKIGIYQYLSVVFVAILNWLLWNSVPNGQDILGAILVALAGIIIIRSGKSVPTDPLRRDVL